MADATTNQGTTKHLAPWVMESIGALAAVVTLWRQPASATAGTAQTAGGSASLGDGRLAFNVSPIIVVAGVAALVGVALILRKKKTWFLLGRK